MDLRLPPPPGGFTSASRRSGASAEDWAAREMYCPRCAANALTQMRTNTRVVDLTCPSCALRVQVKGKKSAFGRKFQNSAYEPKMEAMRARTFPDYALVRYDAAAWTVRDVTLVPGFLLTPASIEKRNPLKPTARRAGWVGSNVVLDLLPPDAQIPVVTDARPRRPADVRRDYARFERLRHKPLDHASWTMDVLREVRRLAPVRGTEFTLRDLYASAEGPLGSLHPANRHVREKMRQQLQVLRDAGVLAFLERGRYRVVK